MASVSRQPNGRKTIQFVAPDGKRRSIRLGKASVRLAEAIKIKVESLAAALLSGHAIDDETARWVANLDKTMADKLSAVGLIPERETASLDAFLSTYIQSRTDVKPLTILKYVSSHKSLVAFFGAEKRLRDITPADAKSWRRELLAGGRVENTVQAHCSGKAGFRVCGREGIDFG